MNGPQPPSFPTVGAALEWARRELRRTESGSLLAQVLLAHLARQTRTWILAHPESGFSPTLSDQYILLIRAARGGKPLAYLTGVQEFFGLEFEVSPDVLIPRPETELLVTAALQWLSVRNREESQSPRPIRTADLGTGSGCIAVCLAVHTPGVRVVAAEISSRALTVAARNIRRYGVSDRVSLVQADLLAPLAGPFDLVCANLPYCPTETLAGLDVRHFEPALARDGGADGLRLIERALHQLPGRLAAGGLALFEIEASHASEARKLARRLFPQALVKVKKDLAGRERLLIVQA